MQEKAVRLSSEELAHLKDVGSAPVNVRLIDYLQRKLRVIRAENDMAEGIYLTRNQGRALMLVELLKVLGVEEDK